MLYRVPLFGVVLTALALSGAHAATNAEILAQVVAEQKLFSNYSNLGFNEYMGEAEAQLVRRAMNFLGVPYLYGGTDASMGFDCSGFTRYVFKSSLGLLLPRLAEQQARSPSLVSISRTELQPGDLVFFNTLQRTFSHVGIYVGGGKFIHAPRTGTEIRVERMASPYWSQRYTGARRATKMIDRLSAATAPQ